MRNVITNLWSLLFLLLFMGCSGDDEPSLKLKIENVTLDNFPIMDGSTSTSPLRDIVMCRTLDLPYKWKEIPLQIFGYRWKTEVDFTSLTEENIKVAKNKLLSNGTHDSFVNLIDGSVELIIAARGISRDEKVYATTKGVELIERPIGKDAFAFILNKNNPIASLSIEQIQKVYTGDIRNWKDVGGEDAVINPYIRDANSGSQEKMETTIMKGLTMIDWPEMVGGSMISPYHQLEHDVNGIAYTPFYYYKNIVDNDNVKLLGVNGVLPSSKTIKDGSYPYVTEIYAVVRADIDHSSTAYKIFEALQTSDGQTLVEESKYISIY